MVDPIHETLLHVLETVLEQFAFAFCELVDTNELHSEESEFIHSSLVFSGPVSGELSLTMPAELCAEIARNVLGMDSEEGDIVDYAQDTLKELLNVYVGNVLTSLYGEDVLFDFGTPVITRLDEIEWKSLVADPQSIGIVIEDTPVILQFNVKKN